LRRSTTSCSGAVLSAKAETPRPDSTAEMMLVKDDEVMAMRHGKPSSASRFSMRAR
jgi:hypothetical protein